MDFRTLQSLQAPLSARLAERAVVTPSARPPGQGRYVMYWMRVAVRGHENAALDAAIELAAHENLPVFVYHAVSDHYPWASDRHHRFLLEGARAVASELAARGVAYAFHLEREGHRGPHLVSLAADARWVVTEDAPIGFLDRWTRHVAEASGAPVVLVDASCVAPMRRIGRGIDRAFQFRKVASRLQKDRIFSPWPEPRPARSELPALPFLPLPIATATDAEIGDWIAACDIDHGVGPVWHTEGGSRAGYARWNAFRDRHLAGYARRRNDALLPEAVSRMSAYLHYGNVSPWRLAREAVEHASSGGEKFLDELLTWRELAWTWCRYTPEHASLDALPAWARETLAAHEDDPRPALWSWERGARARTGDPLWDEAQRSLLVHGELHNNVRMTWGKEVLRYTPDAERAFRLLRDWNHRFALDGRDPSSYGGILWCLGALDRPFTPPTPIFGEVRPRSSEEHARRLDPERWKRVTGRPVARGLPTVLVVGGGVAGATCARTLVDHGLEVLVLDKGRGPGGRLATRRTPIASFDHGAQYVTASTRGFRRTLGSWGHDGVVAPWEGTVVRGRPGALETIVPTSTRWVGRGGMSAIVRHLLADVPVRFEARVHAVERDPSGWTVRVEGDDAPLRADALVLAIPAEQARALVPATSRANVPAGVASAPCWTLLLVPDRPLNLSFDAALPSDDETLGWLARQDTRPGMGGPERWVVQANAAASRAMLEETPETVVQALLDGLAPWVGRSLVAQDQVFATAHRWRYANAEAAPAPDVWKGERCAWDAALRLALAGDAWGGPGIEEAWRSGIAAAGRVLSLGGVDRVDPLHALRPTDEGPLFAALEAGVDDGGEA